jgi:hypothetical protein
MFLVVPSASFDVTSRVRLSCWYHAITQAVAEVTRDFPSQREWHTCILQWAFRSLPSSMIERASGISSLFASPLAETAPCCSLILRISHSVKLPLPPLPSFYLSYLPPLPRKWLEALSRPPVQWLGIVVMLGSFTCSNTEVPAQRQGCIRSATRQRLRGAPRLAC